MLHLMSAEHRLKKREINNDEKESVRQTSSRGCLELTLKFTVLTYAKAYLA